MVIRLRVSTTVVILLKMQNIGEKIKMNNRNLLLSTIEMKLKKLFHQENYHKTRYQNLFLGYFFFFHDFGDKTINYRENSRNNYLRNRDVYKAPKNGFRRNTNITSQRFADINYNSFAPLMSLNIECYKCINFGHKAHECKSRLETTKQDKKEGFIGKHEE